MRDLCMTPTCYADLSDLDWDGDRQGEMRRGLNHVELYVADLSRSVDFWGWLLPELGYEQYQVWDSGRSWRLEDTYLVVVQAEPNYKEQTFHRKRPGLNHLAFWAKSRSQVEALPDLLRKRGIRVLYSDRSAGDRGAPSAHSVFFEDPDRIKVEVVVPEEA